MNKTAIGCLAFIFGSAIGFVASWKILEKKYKKIADEEIASVKEVFSKKYEEKKDQPEVIGTVIDKEVTEDGLKVKAKINSEYIDYVKQYSPNEEKVGDCDISDVPSAPYIIRPDQFDELDFYTGESLNYYSDGVLTDDFDNRIPEEEIEGMIGKDWVDHFGDYEEDTVYIRNEDLQIDYEIVRDSRKYTEVVVNE